MSSYSNRKFNYFLVRRIKKLIGLGRGTTCPISALQILDNTTMLFLYFSGFSGSACDEPFGREIRVEGLRVERLSRIEFNDLG